MHFRLFVSSTFADLAAEREAIHAVVFPKLRALCAGRGAHFQPVDLRWGVSQEAQLDQRTAEICLQEVRRCQERTVRPNFLVLLGERYGWRPAPARIPVAELDELVDGLDPAAAGLVRDWYRLDENARPPEYLLRPRDGAFADPVTWARCEAALRAATTGHTRRAASITEQEIAVGVTPSGAADVHCFFRTIEGEHRFREDGAAELARVKDELRAAVGAANVHEYATHRSGDHLDAMCADIYTVLASMIEAELDRLGHEGAAVERTAHERFARGRRRDFVGRTAELRSVVEHVTGPANTPVGVVGRSGVGKTAFLSMIAAELARACPDRDLVVRFAGATGRAADPTTLLGDLLAELTSGPDTRTRQFHELVDVLRTVLTRDRDRPVVLVVDALDQLESPGRPLDLGWLPDTLPPDVRVVVSAMDGSAAAGMLRRRLSTVVEIEPMPGHEGAGLLDGWLARAGRTLRSHQRDEVLRAFTVDGLPLHLRLATDEALGWTSFTPAADTRIADSVPALVEQVFARLADEREHGPVLVERALGYLAAARHGLGEDELLDVLSADPAVRADLRRRFPHSPDVAEVPDVLWARLHADLEPYLHERRADDTILLGFYHRQLGESAERVFLRDGGPAWHAALAHYFRFGGPATERRVVAELPRQQALAGQWDELHRTLTALSFVEAKVAADAGGDQLAEDARFATDHAPADHPLVADVAGLDRLLGRAAHLLGGWDRGADPGRVAQLFLTAAEDYGLPAWAARARARLDELSLARLERRWRTSGPRDRALVRTVTGHPGDVCDVAVRPGAHEVVTVSRWAQMYDDGSNEEFDDPPRRWDLRTGAVLQVLGPLRSEHGGHPLRPDKVAITPDGRYAVLEALWELLVWDLDAGIVVHRTTIPRTGRRVASLSTPDGRRYAVFADRATLRVWLAPRADDALARLVEASADFDELAVDAAGRFGVSGPGPLRVWDLATGRVAHELSGSGSPAAVDPAGRWAVAAFRDDQVGIWDLAGGRQRAAVRTGGRVDHLVVTAGGRRAVVTVRSRGRLIVLDLDAGALSHTIDGLTEAATVAGTAPDEVVAVYAGGFRVWQVTPAPPDEAARAPGHEDRVIRAALFGDGLRAVTASFRDLATWDLRRGERRHTFGGDRGIISDLVLCPDRRHAIVARDRGPVELWDLEEGRLVREIDLARRTTYVAVSADGGRFAACGYGEDTTVWELTTGTLVRSLPGPSISESPRGLALTPDGRQALVAVTHAVHQPPLDGGRPPGMWSVPSITYQAYAGGPEVRSITLVPDGTLVLVARGGHVGVWDVRERRMLRSLEHGSGETVESVAVGADGRLAVVGAGESVAVCEIATGRRIARAVMAGMVTAVAISVDGSAVLVGGIGGTVDCLRLADHTSSADAAVAPVRTFVMRYRTFPGEQVLVAGSAAELGGWDLSGAVRMSWTDGHVWRATVSLRNGATSYKYVLLRPGRPPRWETGPDRETGDDPVLYDAWRV